MSASVQARNVAMKSPPAVSRAQLGSAEHFTDHGNSAAAPQVRVRHAWQHGGDPLIGSNGAVRGVQAGAAAGRRAHCNLWSAPAHRRHTYATVLLPPSMASVPTSATPRRSSCSACPCLREACTRKQCIRRISYAGNIQSVTTRDRHSRHRAVPDAETAQVAATPIRTQPDGGSNGSAHQALSNRAHRALLLHYQITNR